MSDNLLAIAKRWIYKDQRPNWIAKFLNNGFALIASSGMMPNYMVTLEVKGRKSGRIIAFPVVIALVAGERYLVSMLGDDAQWVRNVRAANGHAVIRSGQRKDVQLEDVAIEKRAPIIKAYLQRANGARPHIPVNKDAPLAEFAKIASEFPVFRIVALDQPSSSA
jgi:hypothetical protein